MRKWKVLTAILAVASAIPTVGAQTYTDSESVLQELKALKARVNALETENKDLRGVATAQNDGDLELQINALTDRLVAGTTVKSAANPVTLTGEFRFRNAWSFGDNAPGTTPPGPFAGGGAPRDEHDGSWTDSLIRIGIQYEFTRDVTAFIEMQSTWAFGDRSSTDFGQTNTPVRTHQAWVEVRNVFDRPEFSTRLGRQEIALGNQFQFGTADWFSGWAFDAARYDWDSESFSLTGIIAKLDSVDGDFNQGNSFRNSHDDDELYSLYFTLKTIENHELDLYWIYINGQGGAANNGSGRSIGALGNAVGDPAGAGTAYYHTIGGRIGGIFPDIAAGLDWNVEVAYQFGDQNIGGGNEIDIDAFAIEAELGLTFNKDSMFRVFVRFLYAEGPDNNNLGYVPMYTNRHSNNGFRARYGLIDLIPMTNVLTVQGGFHFDPTAEWTLGATVLWATTDEDIVAANDDDYGWEIDVWAEYRYSEHLIFGAGLAFVFADDQGQALWGIDDDTQFYGYLQARLLF